MPKHPVPSGELVIAWGLGRLPWGGVGVGLGLSEAAWHFCGQLLWGPATKKAKVGSPKEDLSKEGSFGL